MDFSFLYIFFLLVAPALVIICLNLILPSRKSSNNQSLPPGNTGMQLYVGETLQFANMGRKGTPEIFFIDRMKKFSNQVFQTSLIGHKTAVFCGASSNKFLFTNEDKLVGRYWPSVGKKLFPHSGETVEDLGESSANLRRLLYKFFNPEGLQTCVETIDILAKDHLKQYWEDDQISVLPLIKKFSFTVSFKLFLNIDADLNSKKMKDFGSKLETFFAAVFSLPIDFPGTALNRGIRAANFIREELLDIIRQRKDVGTQSSISVDYLSSLLKSRDENGKILMSELQISDQLVALLMTSRDSTVSTITSTIKYLAEYPLVYDQVLKEQRRIAEEKPEGELLNWKDLQKMKYTWAVVCEVLRLVPPAQGSFREALQDFTYSNFFIPKGWKLYWSPLTTHRDPRYFPEPEKFDPSRFEGNGPVPYAYVPFGAGKDICPGKDLARIVILVFLYNVVGKFRWEKSIPDEKIVIKPLPFPEKGLPVRLIPHSRSP